MPKVAIFTVQQLPVNLLKPPTESRKLAYWSSWCELFGEHNGIVASTRIKMFSVLERMDSSRKPGDLYMSLKDSEYALWRTAQRERQTPLETAARALQGFNAELGKTAFIREAPSIEGCYDVIVFDYVGLAPNIHGFISAIQFLFWQLKTTAEGTNE